MSVSEEDSKIILQNVVRVHSQQVEDLREKVEHWQQEYMRLCELHEPVYRDFYNLLQDILSGEHTLEEIKRRALQLMGDHVKL